MWAAWGLAYLRGRDYEGAREKLKHALTAAGSVNQSLLGRVIDVLEECPTPTLEDIAFIQTQMQEMHVKLKAKPPKPSTSSVASGGSSGGVGTPAVNTAAAAAAAAVASPGGAAAPAAHPQQINLYPASAEDVFAVNAVRLGKVSMESNLDSRRFFEGQFYLKTYGSSEALVKGEGGGWGSERLQHFCSPAQLLRAAWPAGLCLGGKRGLARASLA